MINFYKLLEFPEVHLLTQKIFSIGRKRALLETERIIKENCSGWTLDLGAGTGRYDHLFKEKFINSDINLRYLRFIKRRKSSANCISMKAEEISFKANAIDSIVSIGLFHHVNDDSSKKIFSEMLRIIKPNGIIILVDIFYPVKETKFFRKLVYNLICKLDRGKYARTPNRFENIIHLDCFKYKKIEIRGAFPYYLLAYIIHPQ